MRPIASEQNPLRYPLNELLGTRAHVRLLRVMANEVYGPLTASDVAKRAGLTLPGAQKALRKLFRSGFVSRVGRGQKHQYEIHSSDRLMKVVLELFQAEKGRSLHRLSRKIADTIEQDTSLVPRALEYVDRLLMENHGMATRDIKEWRDILETYSIQCLSRFLTSTSERANRLRQSNPFFAVLNSDEKARMASALEDKSDT